MPKSNVTRRKFHQHLIFDKIFEIGHEKTGICNTVVFSFLPFICVPHFLSFIFSHTDASRSRQELSNEYMIVQIGVDTAVNEPSNFQFLIPTQAFLLAYPYPYLIAPGCSTVREGFDRPRAAGAEATTAGCAACWTYSNDCAADYTSGSEVRL